MPTERFYAVDSIGDKAATLVGDSGDTITVALQDLPAGIREGTVLRVPRDAQVGPDWRSAQIDAAETERRKREAEETLKELRRRDPGGDIKL